MSDNYDITGMDKAALLAGLYNNSKPLGLGIMQYDRKPMTIEEAQKIIQDNPSLYFDYLHGRVMKIDLSTDQVSSRLYDRDNGVGAFEKVLTQVKQGNLVPEDVVDYSNPELVTRLKTESGAVDKLFPINIVPLRVDSPRNFIDPLKLFPSYKKDKGKGGKGGMNG